MMYHKCACMPDYHLEPAPDKHCMFCNSCSTPWSLKLGICENERNMRLGDEVIELFLQPSNLSDCHLFCILMYWQGVIYSHGVD